MRFLPPLEYKLETGYEEMYCSNIDNSKALWKNMNLTTSVTALAQIQEFQEIEALINNTMDTRRRNIWGIGIYSSGSDLLTSQRKKKEGIYFLYVDCI